MKRTRGYRIEVTHFYCFEYYEGTKKMIVEMDFREPFYILSKKLIKHWEPPYQDEILDNEDKERMLSNIHKYLLSRTKPTNIILDDI